MPTTAGRRLGIAVVLVLLAGAAGSVLLPLGAGSVRLGGLSLLWWYAGVAAPSAAVLVTTLVLSRRGRPPESGTSSGPPS